jgi:CIC family chloride channel protein
MKLPKWTIWFQPVAGGLGVGLMGFFIPEVLGVGYDVVDKALNGDLVLKLLVLLAVLKIVATALCYGSGNAGGIFGPSLFIGAMIGGSVGSVAHTLLPGYTAEPGAYALVGMGTAFAGIVRTPLTSVIMIFEMTRDYTIIVPLMISNLIAFYISHKLQKEPIYEALAGQDGVRLPNVESRAQAGRMQVLHAMRPAPEVFSPDTEVAAALVRARRGPLDAWPVADAAGLWGMIRNSELETAVANGAERECLADLLKATPLDQHPDAGELVYAYPDDSLSVVLERMGKIGCNVVPVVSRADVRQLVGVVTLDDILKTYGIAKPASLEE